MHQANDSRVLAVVYYYVGILEYEKWLQKDKQQAGRLGYGAHDKRDLTLGYGLVIVKIGLKHLDQAQTTVDHGANRKYGSAYTHVELASAVLVIVGEIVGRQIAGRNNAWQVVARTVRRSGFQVARSWVVDIFWLWFRTVD